MRFSNKLGVATGMSALAVILVLVAVATRPVKAAIVTNDLNGGLTATDLANALVGTGVTVSNVTFVGANAAGGTFAGGTAGIGFNDGVILSSGSVASVIGPNVDDGGSTDNMTVGDADLSVLAGTATLDAAVLEFDFIPAGGVLQFDYVFASEEYNEYVFQFNDVFAFYVNGTNCALVPGTSTPVTISTINNGNPYGTNGVNSAYYRNNDLNNGGGSIDTEMDGLTTVLTCTAAVNTGVTNHMKLAIADADDGELDTVVFLRGGSLAIPTLTPTFTSTPVPGTATSTPTATPVPATVTPTATATATPTATAIPADTATSTPTTTPVPADTATSTPTTTPVPADTATSTPTTTPVPADTATSTPTYTAVPATATPTETAVPADTATSTPTETAVPADTATSTPTETAVPADTATNTALPADTATSTPTDTDTPTAVPTATRTNTPEPDATDTPDAATATIAAGEPPASAANEVAVGLIGPGGGVVETTSGESVTFPAGTFDEDVLVTLSVYDHADVPAPPAGAVILGNAIVLDAEGNAFDPPATITFPYDPLYVVDPATLGIWAYIDGSWTFLGGTVDATSHTVSARVVMGAMYALMSRPLAAPPQSAAEGLPATGMGPRTRNDAGLLSLLTVLAWLSGGMIVLGWRIRRS